MSRNIIYKVNESTRALSKLTNVTPIKENNGVDISYLYAPYGADTVMLKLLPNKFFELTNVNPIPAFKCTRITDQEIIDALVPEADSETGWYLWAYTIGVGVSGILKSNRASQYQVSFQRLEVDLTDDDYIGNYATASTVDATISTELDVAYPSAVEGNYVNVYKTTSNLYTSWLLVSTTWVDQDELTNETLIDNTLVYNETFKATTVSNDEFNIGTPTEQALVFNQIYGELEDINTVLSAIVGDVAGLMTKAEYDTNDNGIVDLAEGVKNEADTASVIIVGSEMTSKADSMFLYSNHATDFSEIDILDSQIEISNFDTTNGDSEIFLVNGEMRLLAPKGIRIYDEAGTDYAVIDFANGDFRVAYNGITKEYGKNLFVGIKARTIIGENVVLQYDGAVGTSGKIWVKIADKDEINLAPHLIVGVSTTTLTANEEQDVNFYGAINEIDTTGFDGNSGTSADLSQILYFDSVNGLGGMTLTKPEAPNVQIKIGIISTYHATTGQIKVRPDLGMFLADLHDVHINGHTFIGGEIITYNLVNERYEIDNINNYSFKKTGFDVDVMTLVSLAFVNATRTFTLAKTGDVVDYFVSNVKYTLDTDKTVVIDDVEGVWFIYLVGDTLTASQTAWDLRADDAAPVSAINWDATNKVATAVAYEVHSHAMSGVDHYDSHFGLGTLHIRGLAVSDSGSDTLNVTAGVLADEDINITIVDDDTPTAYWEQPLTPLKSYKYYRDGANGNLRRADDSTSPFYVVGNKVQLNPFTGGVWTLTDMTVNKFGAYWVLGTSDITNSVKMILGQAEADSLNNAQEENTLSSLDLGSIPFEEIKVLYRVIVQQKSVSPYYEITQIDSMLVDPITGIPTLTPSSHGGLTGLLDDDHPQYYNTTRLDAYKVSDIDPDIVLRVARDLSIYTEDLLLHGNEKFYMEDGTTSKRTTPNALASYIGGLSGSVIYNGKYYDTGLGAHDTALVKVFTATNTTDADLLLDILDTAIITDFYATSGLNKRIKIIVPSSLVDDTAHLTLTIDSSSGTPTVKDILVNGSTIIGSAMLGQELDLLYTTDGFVYNGSNALPIEQSYYKSIDSTFGSIAPVDFASPLMKTIYGLSVNQMLNNGNFASGVISPFVSNSIGTPVVTDEIVSFTATAQYARLSYEDILTIGQSYYLTARIKTLGTDLRLRTNGGALSVTHSGSGEWEILSVKGTAVNTRIDVIDYMSSGWVQVDVDYIMAIPISNTSYSGRTADELNTQFPTYLPYGYNDLINPEFKFTGLNLANLLGTQISRAVGFNNTDLVITKDRMEIAVSTANITVILMKVLPSTTYFVKANDYGLTTTATMRAYKFSTLPTYTLDGTYINDVGASGLQFTTDADTQYVGIGLYINSGLVGDYIGDIQLEQGTVATDYRAYASPTDNFKLLNIDGSDIAVREVGSVRDRISFVIDHWEYIQRVGFVEDESIGATINYADMPTGGVFTAFDSVNNEYQSGVKGDTLTLTGVADIRYELTTAEDGVELDQDGSTTQEITTTIEQVSLASDYMVEYALNDNAQNDLNTIKIIGNKKEISANEVSITTNATAIALREVLSNKVIAFSTPTDDEYPSAKLVDDRANTNDTAVGLNTTHRGSDGKNHSDVVLNNTHRSSDGKNHSDVVTNTADILKRVEFTEIWSNASGITVTADTSLANATVFTLSQAYSDFDELHFLTEYNNTFTTLRATTGILRFNYAGANAIDTVNCQYNLVTSTTTLKLYSGIYFTIEAGGWATATTIRPTIYKIIGINY